MSGLIFVTGATGNVGSEICRLLREGAGDDPPAVAAAVGARRLDERGEPDERTVALTHGARTRAFDFTDEAGWGPALEGVDRVFLMRPPHIANIRRDMLPFLEYVKSRGVRQLVFLSVQGAERNSIVPHHRIEEAIRELGIPFTFIRPSFFMQNLTTTHLHEIRNERRIFVPAGDGRTNFIDVRDIAAFAAQTLTRPGHVGEAYTITGDEDLTYHEVASILSDQIGHEVRYEPAGLVRFLAYQRQRGRNVGHALVMYALYSVTRLGRAGTSTGTFEQVMGRPPVTLRQFVAHHQRVLAGELGHDSGAC